MNCFKEFYPLLFILPLLPLMQTQIINGFFQSNIQTSL